VCHSVSRITEKVTSRFHWNLLLWLGLPVRTDKLLVGLWCLVPDTDFGSVFHFPHRCRIGDFRRFISISHHQIVIKLSEITGTDKIMNPQYFGRDPADICIRINPAIWIGIPDHLWLKFWH